MKYFLALFFIFIFVPAQAQNIKTSFNQIFFEERFEEDKGIWPVTSDAEGIFLIQDNRFFIKRHRKEGVQIIKPEFRSALGSFRLMATIALEPKSPGHEAGIVFMLQNDLSGYLVEINDKKEYRIRKLESNHYHYITGTKKSGGWVKSNLIKAPGEWNTLELRAEEMVYDIFINNSFVQTFADVTWRNGGFGLVIGPETAANVNDIYLFVSGDNDSVKNYPATFHDLDSLRKENIYLKETLEKIASETGENSLLILSNELQTQKFANDSLTKVNQQLQQKIINLEKTLELERSKPVPEKVND